MSADQTPDPVQAASDAPFSENPARVSHKSFRRKYRKIMVKFEEKMRDSTSHFKDEQRMLDISQRLAEQTDELLELLDDLNACPQIPARYRYDLQVPGLGEAPKPTTSIEFTHSNAQLELKAARKRLMMGQWTPLEYRQLEDAVLASPDFRPRRSYISMKREAPTVFPTFSEIQQESVDANAGFLSSRQEEEYLQGLDSYLSGTSTTPRPHAANSLGARLPEKSVEREKQAQLKNPVSVYNWLRKHQPQVFLQDHESQVEKQPRGSNSRSSKRASTVVKQEPDAPDEEAIAADPASNSRGKRKRDDDGGAYRPKGGNSRPGKRKKDDIGGSGRKSKKLSISEHVS